jgi:hypothetical protein
MFIVSAQTRANRLNICRECEHFVGSTKSCGPLVTEAFTDSKLCGCHMPTKTRLKWAECPLGKWGAVITAEQLKQVEEFLDIVKSDPKSLTDGDLADIYNRVLGTHEPASNCSGCNRKMVQTLKKLINESKRNNPK